MCKHITNMQVQVYTECCEKYYDCQFCHDVAEDHEYQKHEDDVTFKCKNCEKVFTVDMTEMEEADQFCPKCDNQFVIEPSFD